MSLVRWTPMWDPFDDMEDVMNLPLRQAGRLPMVGKSFIPALDVYETKDAVVVEAPLPGIDAKDVQVSVEKGVLTISGETKKEHEVDEKNYYRKEVRSGSFYRQVALPAPVKEDGVSAEFADGVLKISCPKTTPAQAKKIDVKIVKKNGK